MFKLITPFSSVCRDLEAFRVRTLSAMLADELHPAIMGAL
jgi:hypothetical protein